ncbi:MAG: ACP S-malonyltransferase [Thermoanaerobaculia bacterium]
MAYGFVFPGQGSQRVGMGRAWAESFPVAAEVFEQADEALGLPLSRLCFEGPEEELQLTANTQPAILAASVAILRVLEQEGLAATAAAGHSLGEYSALVAAGALPFADALRLVRRRGELMQQAVPVGQGAMAAILGLDIMTVNELVEEAADEDLVCTVANFNSPQQTVIAGHTEAVKEAARLAKLRGGGKAVLLPVSAPFHSPLMKPARRGMEPLLRETSWADPKIPVVTNIDAAPVEDAESALDALMRQIDGPVRWVESVRALVDDLELGIFIEVGPGNVLSGLIRRIAPEVTAVSCAEPEDLEKVRATVAGAAPGSKAEA